MSGINRIRIIGGEWRGSLVQFPNMPNLRPTPNRIRETLFNWLAPHIVEACCLDLFAGSGALGLEALSRGAKKVTFIDENPQVISALNMTIQRFKAQNRAEILKQDSLVWLQERQQQKHQPLYNAVFLDPPYSDNTLDSCFNLLAKNTILSQNALIYFESNYPINNCPPAWHVLKTKKAASVYYYLAKVGP